MIQNAVLNITQALGAKQDFTSCEAILALLATPNKTIENGLMIQNAVLNITQALGANRILNPMIHLSIRKNAKPNNEAYAF